MIFLPESERFFCVTPLGPALVYGLEPDLAEPEWLTFVNATGEPWWWMGKFIRRRPHVTNGFRDLSPFPSVNAETRAHISRYKLLGALPGAFDPTNVSTWEFRP